MDIDLIAEIAEKTLIGIILLIFLYVAIKFIALISFGI